VTATVPVLIRFKVVTTCVVDFLNQNYCTTVDVNVRCLVCFHAGDVRVDTPVYRENDAKDFLLKCLQCGINFV
jgi:hypothetical protein